MQAAHLAHGEERLLLGGAGRQRGGKLADAEERYLRELAGTELPESLLLRRVFKAPIESLDLRDFVHHPVEDRRLGQIDIFSG